LESVDFDQIATLFQLAFDAALKYERETLTIVTAERVLRPFEYIHLLQNK
jgi:hypothetical protein